MGSDENSSCAHAFASDSQIANARKFLREESPDACSGAIHRNVHVGTRLLDADTPEWNNLRINAALVASATHMLRACNTNFQPSYASAETPQRKVQAPADIPAQSFRNIHLAQLYFHVHRHLLDRFLL
jgi:hypothetical protein